MSAVVWFVSHLMGLLGTELYSFTRVACVLAKSSLQPLIFMCVKVLPECMAPETGGLLIVNHVGLGIKPGSSARATNALQHCANSEVPCIKNVETHPGFLPAIF